MSGTTTKEKIDISFRNYPLTNSQMADCGVIRDKAKELAHCINELFNDSREKSLSITSLEQCVFWANAGVARNQ